MQTNFHRGFKQFPFSFIIPKLFKIFLQNVPSFVFAPDVFKPFLWILRTLFSLRNILHEKTHWWTNICRQMVWTTDKVKVTKPFVPTIYQGRVTSCECTCLRRRKHGFASRLSSGEIKRSIIKLSLSVLGPNLYTLKWRAVHVPLYTCSNTSLYTSGQWNETLRSSKCKIGCS